MERTGSKKRTPLRLCHRKLQYNPGDRRALDYQGRMISDSDGFESIVVTARHTKE